MRKGTRSLKMKKRHNRNQKGQKRGKEKQKPRWHSTISYKNWFTSVQLLHFTNMNSVIIKSVEISNKCSFEGCDGRREGDRMGGKAREMVWPDRIADTILFYLSSFPSFSLLLLFSCSVLSSFLFSPICFPICHSL